MTHLGTELMYANVLTKPIQAGHFKGEKKKGVSRGEYGRAE